MAGKNTFGHPCCPALTKLYFSQLACLFSSINYSLFRLNPWCPLCIKRTVILTKLHSLISKFNEKSKSIPKISRITVSNNSQMLPVHPVFVREEQKCTNSSTIRVRSGGGKNKLAMIMCSIQVPPLTSHFVIFGTQMSLSSKYLQGQDSLVNFGPTLSCYDAFLYTDYKCPPKCTCVYVIII